MSTKPKPHTKVCIVKNCEHHKGTRLPIRMFQVPGDELKRKNWEQSFIFHKADVNLPLKGMVCVNHFHTSDLNNATKTKPISLKKDAIPKVFNFEGSGGSGDNLFENGDNFVYGHDAPTEPAINEEICSNDACTNIRIRCDELSKDKIDRETYIVKLEKKIADQKAHIELQSKRIRSMDMQIRRASEAKIKLKGIITELQQENLIKKEATDILEVCFSFKYLKIFLENRR